MYHVKKTVLFASNIQGSRGSLLLQSLFEVPTSNGLGHIKQENILPSGFSKEGLFLLIVDHHLHRH